jgi:hypothetical protein
MIQFFIAFGIFFSAELRLVNPEGEAATQKALAPSSGMSCRACRSMAAALGLLGFAS